MSLYDRAVRSLIHNMVEDLARNPDDEFTREEVLAWFKSKYPKVKGATVSAHLIMITTNLPSRVHYGPRAGGEDDLLFQLERGRYRRYDRASDPPPIHDAQMSAPSILRERLLPIIEGVYPAWTGFDDPRFVAEEVTYKQRAVAAAAEMLNAAELGLLVEQGEFNEIIDRLKSVARKGGNLLWVNMPDNGDLRILSVPGLDRPAFCHALYDLLYGGGESHDRLARYLDYVAAAGLPTYWAFPTYFLFVCHPDSELLVKPTWIKKFLDLIDRRMIMTDAPRAETYEKLLRLAGELRAAFAEFDPSDMVDIQSLMWVCADNGGSVPTGGFDVDVKRVEVRAAAEKRSRSLVERSLGTFDEAGLREFLREVNTDWENGRIHYNRFGTTFGGSLVAMMVEHIDDLNIWTERIWNANDTELDSILDEFWKTGPVKGAGRGYATMLLYLKDPHHYPIWLPALDRGLAALADYAPTKARTAAEYRRYLTAVLALRTDRGLAPQALDLVLWRASENTGPAKPVPIPIPNPDAAFTQSTFDLLNLLHQTPVKATYLERKQEFRDHLEEPFDRLLEAVATRLPEQVLERMETRQGTTARILKNDYGRGGAWDYYWGAFYPKGGRRTEDAQLYVWINKDRLEYGFYIGEYGTRSRERFIAGCRQHQDLLQNVLAETMLEGVHRRFGRRPEFVGGTMSEDRRAPFTFLDWIGAPERYGIQVGVIVPRADVIATPFEDLATMIASGFQELYVLVLLALEDRPVGPIRAWLGLDVEKSAVNPEHSVAEIAAKTGFAVERLNRWISAINRKKQAIIYGPPGTGKTYIAKRLAEHLIGGGDGVSETVQFHPAYAYEDFMQGIRPQLTANGELDYKMMRGRFLEFCDMAAERTGLCVMIVDEINRANLARVMGELMYLLEYRDEEIPLAGGDKFRIPDNVRIIGTMNTADRSIALVDHALRRRFAFLELCPEFDVLLRYHEREQTGFPAERLVAELGRLNNAIGDPHYSIGISYFLRPDLADYIEDIWRMEIEPYLAEYFYDQREKAKAFSWGVVGERIRA